MVTTQLPPSQQFSLNEALARHPYFASLSVGQVEEFALRASRCTFTAGETIFHEGAPCAGLWIIESGSVKVFKVNPDGIEHILHLLGPGDAFNEIAAVDGGPNPANAAALSDTIAWMFSAETIRAALTDYPDLAMAIIHILTGRVRLLVQKIEDLALYPVAARLARFLLQQSEYPSLEGPGVTRAAIAAYLATTPETVSRVLRSLQDAGAIRFDRHQIIITNLDLLRAVALL